MKRQVLLFSVIFSFSIVAWPQEIFDLLRKGDVPAAKALIEESPQLVDARDTNGNTPLHYAAYGRDAGLVNFLIDKGAKLELQDAHVHTPLHIAAMNDRREVVDALLKRGAALETRDDYGRTVLILCARERGEAATGRILIEAGADVNAVDKFGDGALDLAAWRGKGEFIDLLLEKGARVPESGGKWQAGLSLAASKGLTKFFRRLTEKGQAINPADAANLTLLSDAAAGGSAEIVGLLIGKGFDAARADRFGWTPLHYAARDGRTDAARILIEKNAPLNARTIMGQTAYNIARERGMEAAAALLAEKGADTAAIRFPVLKGDYLGQKPPGGKPELFGLGIISSVWGLHSTAVFSPDGNEVYWAPMMTFPGEIYSRGGLMMMKRVNGQWAPPAWAPFSGPNGNDDVPFFSPDGGRLYFISRRPLPGEIQRGSEKVWFADKTPAGWSEPLPLDPAVNEHNMHWEFSLDKEKNLYFAGQAPDSLGMNDIYMARFAGGKYEKPVNLGKPINSAAGENTPFIAPDGSYLVFERQYDLWVSFREDDGKWAEPVKLGPDVNSPSIELCPVITADGKYLFFLSQRDGESHAYWVRADVIEKSRRAAENLAVEMDVVYAVVDGHKLKLDIAVPRNLAAPAPAIIDIQGGAWRRIQNSVEDAKLWAGYGFVGVSIAHRTSDIAVFPAAVHDCKAAIRWLRANAKKYNVDPDKIGVYGFSSGGHLAALLGTSGGDAFLEGTAGNPGFSSRVQAVVDHFGPTDFMRMNDGRQVVGVIDHLAPDSPESLFLGGPLKEKADASRLASPLTYVDSGDPPALIAHGEKDGMVPIEQSEILHEALKKAAVPVEFVRVKNADHMYRPNPDGAKVSPDVDALNRMSAEWFKRWLGSPKLESPEDVPPPPAAVQPHKVNLYYKLTIDLPGRTAKSYVKGAFRVTCGNLEIASGKIDLADLSTEAGRTFKHDFIAEGIDFKSCELTWTFSGEIFDSQINEKLPLMFRQFAKYGEDVEGVGFHFLISADGSPDIQKKVFKSGGRG